MSKLKKIIKSPIFKVAAPLALSAFAPGIGTALGAGLGATGTTASVLGNSLVGAGLGAATGGGLKGALLGGVTGGAGGYLNSGSTALGDKLNSFGNATGLTSGIKDYPGLSAVRSSMGTLTGGSSALSPTTSGGLSNVITKGLSAYGDYSNTSDMEKKLLAAQGKIEGALQPYQGAGTAGIGALQAGFDPSQITSDAGYQFRLQQGQDALQKALAAQGLSGSGAAIKAASDYNQGQAAQAYNDAYSQWLAKNSGLANYGQNAVNSLGNVYNTTGDIQANALASKNNTINELLAGLFRNA